MSQSEGFVSRHRPRLGARVGKDGRTKQSMQKECDINEIMSKYRKTGTLSHFAKHGLRYGAFPATDYRQALHVVMEAEKMFMALPSKTRLFFHNSPEAFLSFVQDEKNLPKMRELGLCKPEEVERISKVEVVKQPAAEPQAEVKKP